MRLFKVRINDLDETGINAMSFVLEPAMESSFFVFSKEEPKQLQFIDEHKHIVTGVALRANFPIVRYDSEGNEYYVVFEKDAIRKMIEKSSKFMTFNCVDVNHNASQKADGTYLIESYVIDRENGINPAMFSEIEDGSWICSYKVENLALWNMIMNGEVTGFSISGLFNLLEVPSEEQLSKEGKPEWARGKAWDKNKKKTVVDIQSKASKESINELIDSFDGSNIDEFLNKLNKIID